jgi:hypothetical protein
MTKKRRAKLLEFPGRTKLESKEKYRPVTEPGTVDGVLIRIGGIDETVPVLLLEIYSKRSATIRWSITPTAGIAARKRIKMVLFDATMLSIWLHPGAKASTDGAGKVIPDAQRRVDFLIETLDQARTKRIIPTLQHWPNYWWLLVLQDRSM